MAFSKRRKGSVGLDSAQKRFGKGSNEVIFIKRLEEVAKQFSLRSIRFDNASIDDQYIAQITAVDKQGLTFKTNDPNAYDAVDKMVLILSS